MKRPSNSTLNNNKIQSYIDFDLPKWEDDFQQVVENLIKMKKFRKAIILAGGSGTSYIHPL